MRFIFNLLFVTGVLSCLTGNPDASGQQLKGVTIFKNGKLCKHSGGNEDCNSRLVSTQSGPDTTCKDSPSLHYWPLGPTSDCHGWQATDPFGKLHDNSANNIRCSVDGKSLLYTQFAASLDCTNVVAAGVEKKFTLDECHQGIPARLWDRARDLSCCGANVDTNDNNDAEPENPKPPASTTDEDEMPKKDKNNFCYLYASYCSTKTNWMLDNCQKTCNYSDGDKPVANPVKKDASQWCYLYTNWCYYQSDWMLGNCQRSCRYGDAIAMKKDKSGYCYLYTWLYCQYKSDWMAENCQSSCGY